MAGDQRPVDIVTHAARAPDDLDIVVRVESHARQRGDGVAAIQVRPRVDGWGAVKGGENGEAGGEAIADTSWSLLNESGDPIKETVGAFASMVLAEGDYTIIAKNRDRIYQKDFTVVAGQNQEIEVVANESAAIDPEEGAD